MKTLSELKQSTIKQLSHLVKELGLSGCSGMRKEELIHAIQLYYKRVARKKKSQSDSETSVNNFMLNGSKKTEENSVKSTKSKKTTKKVSHKAEKPVELTKSTPKGEKTPISSDSPSSRANKTALKSEKASEKPGVRKKSPPPSKDVKASKKTSKSTVESHSEPGRKESRELSRPQSPSHRSPASVRERLSKNISGIYEEINGENHDRFVLLVRDPFWLHVYWELCSRLIERAKAAMGHSWHTAAPVLRLFRIVADGMNNPRRDLIRDIRIHSGVNNWYIDVEDPPGTFQVEIGFLSREGNFFPVASSNIVQTPQNQIVSGTAKLDGHWGSVSDDFERIYKLSGGLEDNNEQLKVVFEEQLQRSMSLPLISRFGARSLNFEKTKRHFDFTVDADVMIYGKTDPSVQISIRGEPIRVANDGSFSVRFALAEKRQVFPIDAKGSDGIETQQVIIAIERNTKVLETVFLDSEDDD